MTHVPAPDTDYIAAEIVERYKDVPEPARTKLIRAEVSGVGFELRTSDIVPRESLRMMFTGDLADALQRQLDKLGAEYSPLDVFLTMMRCAALPMSMRVAAAKEAIPYVNRRMPTSIEGGDPARPIQLRGLPGMTDPELQALEELLARAARVDEEKQE